MYHHFFENFREPSHIFGDMQKWTAVKEYNVNESKPLIDTEKILESQECSLKTQIVHKTSDEAEVLECQH